MESPLTQTMPAHSYRPSANVRAQRPDNRVAEPDPRSLEPASIKDEVGAAELANAFRWLTGLQFISPVEPCPSHTL
jgi:hypothetical protein